MPPAPPSSVPHQAPAGTFLAALTALVALQGFGLIGAGGYLIVRALQPDAGHRGSTEVLGALALLVGLGVLAMARAAWRLRPRVRSPLLVLQLLCLPVAVTALQGGRWYVGVPLAASAVAVIVLLGLTGLLVPRGDPGD